MLFSSIPIRVFRFQTKNILNLTKQFKNRANTVETSIKQSDPGSLGFGSLWRPFIFTISVTGCSFVGATIWQYEEMRKLATRFSSQQPMFKFFQPDFKRTEIRRKLHEMWHSQTEGQKVAAVIIAINLAVFLCWRIPALQPFMSRYFMSSPAAKGSCLPMVLSVFSHYTFFHFAANMYVLYSFSSTAVTFYGKEQFIALFLSAGVWASFTSYAFKIASGRLMPSLGASGALMAILSSMCLQFPDAKLQIVFLPFFTFTAGNAIKALMTLDVVGVVAKWQLFDHAAHLGGAMTGIFYLFYGQEHLWNRRETLLKWYHDIREKKRD